MTPEKEKILCEKYSYMFDGLDSREPFPMFGFECGDGWFKLLDTLMYFISLADVDKTVRVQQIKEKFGDLRFYYSDACPEEISHYISHLVSTYEVLSGFTCEVCGDWGKINDSGWLSCRCKKCRAKENKVDEKIPVTKEELSEEEEQAYFEAVNGKDNL